MKNLKLTTKNPFHSWSILKFNQKGMTLINVMVAASITGVLLYSQLTMMNNQMRATNALEFRMKNTELKGVISNQFLTNPLNCECLFRGAQEFDKNVSSGRLMGVEPTALGVYSYPNPDSCDDATISQPFASREGIEQIITTDISLVNLQESAGSYLGTLRLNVESQKDIAGSKTAVINIPVVINTEPGSTVEKVKFKSCSLGAGGGSLPILSEFVLNVQGSSGVPNPYGLGGTDQTIEDKKSHAASIVYDKMDIPGTFSVCYLSGYRSNAGNDNVYEACFVTQKGPGNWMIEALHVLNDGALECRASCFSL